MRLQTSTRLRLAALLLCAGAALGAPTLPAQTRTQVSATITDPNGLPYSNATIVIQLVGGGSTPQTTPCSFSPCFVQNPPPSLTDASGHFTVSLYANASIAPGGTTWQFNVIEPGVAPPWGKGTQGFSVSTTIAGATDDISSLLSAAAPALTPAFAGGATPCTTSPFAVQINNAGAFGCNANFTYTPSSGLLVRTETGAFLSGSNNYYNQALLSCAQSDIDATISKTGTIIGITPYNYTDAQTACVKPPTASGTATNDEAHALAGYAINGNGQQQGQFGKYSASGVTGYGYCVASNTNCEGLVAYAQDDSSLSSVVLVGFEAGIFPQNTGDHAYGFLYSPYGTVQPSFDNAPAFDIHSDQSPPTNSTMLATSGYRCEAAALTVQNTNFSICNELNPIEIPANGNVYPSQSVAFTSGTGVGTATNTAYLLQENDNAASPAARLVYLPASGAAASITTGAFIFPTETSPVSGCSATGISGGAIGHFTAGATSCTFVVTLPVTTFTEWHCEADDWTNPADHIGQTSSTLTTATLTGTVSASDTIHYRCDAGF